MGCHALLQGIFLTQGSNLHLLGLLYWQVGYHSCHLEAQDLLLLLLSHLSRVRLCATP